MPELLHDVPSQGMFDVDRELHPPRAGARHVRADPRVKRRDAAKEGDERFDVVGSGHEQVVAVRGGVRRSYGESIDSALADKCAALKRGRANSATPDVGGLQGEASRPVGTLRAVGRQPLVLEFEVSVKGADDGVRWLGDHVRREGPERRFVYVAVGTQAGDAASSWSRRMKLDVHTIGADLVATAARDKVLEFVVTGTGDDGTPACATVKPRRAWRAV